MAEKTPWQLWKEKNPGDPVRPWDLLNPKIGRVKDEIQKTRYDMCLTCEHLVKATKTCTKCGCFMTEKTKLPHASCPIGKWDAVTIKSDIIEGEQNG
jgi:hypothetical protein